ncbi:MAG: aldo/keto reductase [Roseimicrobium sp.]
MIATYEPNPIRYENAKFRRCGKSGLSLPAISLGFWQNFGGVNVFETCRAVVRRAFDRGVTHCVLAQIAIAWVLCDDRVTSALIGARSVGQLDDSLDALKNLEFSAAELVEIDAFAKDAGIDLWRETSQL